MTEKEIDDTLVNFRAMVALLNKTMRDLHEEGYFVDVDVLRIDRLGMRKPQPHLDVTVYREVK